MCESSNITRRQALQAAGGTGVAFLFAGAAAVGTREVLLPELAEAAAATCVLTPEKTEGPYFVDEGLDRSDITGGQEGTPLAITMFVFDANGDCAPVPGAVVDMWHANAEGRYSDVAQNQTTGQKWLRGYQITDAEGKATFNTIWPGWYSGRAVHIHFKVRYGSTEFTSQMFFTDAMNKTVFEQAPYKTRGNADVPNAQDGILGGDAATLTLEPTAKGSGYAADFSVGLALGGQTTPPTGTDTEVAAALTTARAVRTRSGRRQVRLTISSDEDVTVIARLTRDGSRIARRKVTLPAGSRSVRIDLGTGVRPGAAQLTVKLSDAAGNRSTVRRSVHVPKRRA